MKRGLVLGLVGAIGTAIYFVLDRHHALAAWSAAFELLTVTGVGALVMVFAFHLVHAKWWFAVRPPFVAIASTLVLTPVFFAPLARGPSAVCALILAGLAELARRDAKRIAAPGLVILAFTFTVAAFEWWMALEPDWVSDIYGLYVFAGGFVAAMAIVAITLKRTTIAPDLVHAVGRLMLCSVLVWAYLGFFQLLLIWMPDLPREVSFYEVRSVGSWAWISGILVVGRFVIPFFALLSRRLKRSPAALATLGMFLLAGEGLDATWIILPSMRVQLSPLDIFPFLAMGGFAWAYGAWVASRLPAAPELATALRYRSP